MLLKFEIVYYYTVEIWIYLISVNPLCAFCNFILKQDACKLNKLYKMQTAKCSTETHLEIVLGKGAEAIKNNSHGH
jgi:hypothetical protein